MSLEGLKKRLVVRATTPAEILYALARHWFLISVCFAAASLVMLARYSTEPNMFGSRVSLHLNINDSLVVEQNSGAEQGGGGSSRPEVESFFASRVRMLTSEFVLRDIVVKVNPTKVLTQEEDPLRPYYGRVRRFLSDVKTTVTDALSVVRRPQPPDHSYECEIQKAVLSLRQRSTVTSDQESSTVELYLQGNNRDLLKAELTQWVESYTTRLNELATKHRDKFIESRRDWWKKLEDEAQKKLDTFKRNNPGISRAGQDLLLQELLHLQTRRADLQKHVELGPGFGSILGTGPSLEDAEKEALLREKAALRVQLSQALYLRGPESENARSLEKALQDLEDRLANLEPLVDPEKSRKAELQDQIKKLGVMITETMRRYTAMGVELDKLQALEDELRIAQRTRSSYQLMKLEEGDLAAARGTVEVQVCDGPYVSWSPIDKKRELHILAGSAAGLLLGIALAFLREALCTRVRFKNDLTSEFGLPVVAVVPRK